MMIRSKRMRWVGRVARIAKYKCIQSFRWNYEEKRPLSRSRCRWDGTIVLDLKEIGSEGVKLIVLALDREKWWAVVNTIMNFRGS